MATIKLTGFNPLTGGSATAGDTGTAEVDGSVVLGNADTDTIVVNAEFDSDLVPDDHEAYDLGEDTKRWRTIYARSAVVTDGFPSYISFGKNNAQTAPLTDFELSTTDGSANAQGWRMPTAGAVTHMTCQFDSTQTGGINSFILRVWKNGVEALDNENNPYEISLIDVASGDVGATQEFSPPLAFAANDCLTLKLSMTVPVGESFSMDDLACLLRVTS